MRLIVTLAQKLAEFTVISKRLFEFCLQLADVIAFNMDPLTNLGLSDDIKTMTCNGLLSLQSILN